MLLRTYLQTQHGISRRKITTLIDQGQIFINNRKVESYVTEIQEQDFLKISSLKIQERVDLQKDSSVLPELLLFNKPVGYVCSKSDPHNATFYQLLPKNFQNSYYYIGRLDKESRGLLLLTTNPELVHLFEHPSKEIQKEYQVLLNHSFNRWLKAKILNGIHDDGEILRTLKIEKSEWNKIAITLNEGKKRHIRRIFHSLGYEVVDLQRIRIGNYALGKLKEGSYCEVKRENN